MKITAVVCYILLFFIFGKIRTIIHEYAHYIAAAIVGEKASKIHLSVKGDVAADCKIER